jgi:Protein of unknown function (DUF3047)
VRRGSLRAGGWRLFFVLAVLAGLVVLLASPRHRALYLGWATSSAPRATSGFAGRPAAVAAAPSLVPGQPAAPQKDSRIYVRVADQLPPRLPAEGAPSGWTTREFVGRASVELVRDEDRLALRLRSEQTSFALYRDVVVDLREFPFLAWSWKVLQLPDGGDVRERARDDQAAQLYVIFPRWPSPLRSSDVLGYVWDTRAPVGTRATSSQASNVKVIVVASGAAHRGAWRLEQRAIAQDYVALFGRQPPRVGRVAVMIDTNDTRGAAEALVGDIAFVRERSENMEIPTSMLR